MGLCSGHKNLVVIRELSLYPQSSYKRILWMWDHPCLAKWSVVPGCSLVTLVFSYRFYCSSKFLVQLKRVMLSKAGAGYSSQYGWVKKFEEVFRAYYTHSCGSRSEIWSTSVVGVRKRVQLNQLLQRLGGHEVEIVGWRSSLNLTTTATIQVVRASPSCRSCLAFKWSF